MKLATFEVETTLGRAHRVGVLDGRTLLDVAAGYASLIAEEGVPVPDRRAAALAPPDMLEFLRIGDDAMDAARTVLSAGASGLPEYSPGSVRVQYDVDAVSLASPLPRPNSIRDFLVFEEHGSVEKVDEWYEMPIYYKGNPDSVVPPGTEVAWPSFTEKLDFELEVSAVVGREGRNVAAEDAEEYIAGYTIFNDFSARDMQYREMRCQLGPAKGKDFANGFGPYLVTADAFDPTDAPLAVRVNGEVWSEGNLGAMYHSFADIVERASLEETIHPGDVLGSGTFAGGCGADLDRWIEPGDVVELDVEGIGTLRHRIGTPASTA